MSVKSGRGTCVIFLMCFKAKRIAESGGAGGAGGGFPNRQSQYLHNWDFWVLRGTKNGANLGFPGVGFLFKFRAFELIWRVD